jgi:DNA invertase Pin-like site-specific DNA recombinase
MTVETRATGQRIGYRRVSTLDQSTARQLEGETLDRVFEDKLSGKDTNRPQLQAMLKHVREGDTVIVHSLDRLGRNLADLQKLIDDLTSRGVAVEFMKEHLTFTGEDTPMARLMLGIMGSVAEFERSMIRERQREGIALAKVAGVYKGRKPALSPEKVAELQKRAAAGESKTALAQEYGVTRQTIYNALGEANAA